MWHLRGDLEAAEECLREIRSRYGGHHAALDVLDAELAYQTGSLIRCHTLLDRARIDREFPDLTPKEACAREHLTDICP